MNILITGDKGFVGSATARELIARGHTVTGYDVMDGRDLRDYEQLCSVIETTRPARILHLGAIARFADADKDPKLCFETNCLGTKNVSWAAAKYHVPVVYASTGSVYMPIKGEPPITEDFPATGNSVYGVSKAIGERYIQAPGNPYIILRYAHLYGKEKRMHGLIGGYVDRIKRGLKPTLYGGKQSNDFTYIDDVVEANILALFAPWDKWNQVYNIGTGEELTAEEAGKAICDALGWKGGVEKKLMREVDPMRFVYSIEKAKTMLGYDPAYTFRKGLKAMFGVPAKKGAKI